ncbi:TonB-dependent receptor [Brevundimonas naejangsanensis]|uniref:TonB-dependent receptor n=1 Tax=Brevundimonas naejangsanensis TaxID=588932 RepID=UPI0026F182C7|nr:TonB-dependent receptor [Brevundimonas naejangsanensis]
MKVKAQGPVRARRRRLFGAASGGVLALALAASPAVAAGSRVFHANIPAQGVREALLDLAVQARVSMGGDIALCRGAAPRLTGALDLETALTRILAGSDCRYTLRRDGAVIIRHEERRAPRAAPTTAQAVDRNQTPVVSENTRLSDVIVTAGRSPETPQTSPSALTSVSGEQILRSGAAGAFDLSALVAGMTVTNLGSGRNKILLRGMSDGAFTGQTQSTVGLYLNRTPLTYSAPDPDLKLVDVDRVEVLRGPQGVLYGTGPIGGVLRIVPEAPDPTREVLSISGAYSDTQGGGSNSDLSFVANVPILNGEGALRVVGYRETSGGYIDDESLNLRRVNSGERHGGRATLVLQLSPEWKMSLGAVQQKIDSEDTHYVYRLAGGHRRANLVREPHSNAFGLVQARVEGRGEWGRIEATTARIDHDFVSRYDASPGLGLFGSTAKIGALDDRRMIDLAITDLSYASPRDRRLRWLAGLFVSRVSTRNEADISALWPFRDRIYDERRADRQSETALFGQAAFDLTEDISLIAGGRYYSFDYETVSRVTHGVDERPFEGRGRDSGFSPRLAIDWRVTEAWRGYGSISQGHRAGGFNTAGPIGVLFSDQRVSPARRYEGDSLWNYEVGAKGTFHDGRVQARLALFHADWRNLQSDQFLPSGLSYAANIGDGANTGVEVDANWRPIDSLEIRANALLARPRIVRKDEVAFTAKGDIGLPGVSAMSANINASWRRPLTDQLTLVADGWAAYVGPSRLTFDRGRHRMGDYLNARLAMGLEGAFWRAEAFVNNPLNTMANTFAFGDPFRLPEALTTTPLQPRTIGLRFSVNPFGS